MGRINWSTSDVEKGLERLADDQAQQEVARHSKYNAKPKTYNGRRYHSTREANYRMQLDLSTKAQNHSQRVVKIEEQVVFKLTLNGHNLGKYILDFRVTYADGHVRHVDVKGMKKGVPYQLFKLKISLLKAIYNIDVEEV